LPAIFATARTDYQQALRDDPGNRDALLGLAAIDVRTGRHEVGRGAYLRLLQATRTMRTPRRA
jgi:cytochrome c-type biogenesis protein CcmH/NrfG